MLTIPRALQDAMDGGDGSQLHLDFEIAGQKFSTLPRGDYKELPLTEISLPIEENVPSSAKLPMGVLDDDQSFIGLITRDSYIGKPIKVTLQETTLASAGFRIFTGVCNEAQETFTVTDGPSVPVVLVTFGNRLQVLGNRHVVYITDERQRQIEPRDTSMALSGQQRQLNVGR